MLSIQAFNDVIPDNEHSRQLNPYFSIIFDNKDKLVYLSYFLIILSFALFVILNLRKRKK